jgi:small nuclear ribonucleoprotein E
MNLVVDDAVEVKMKTKNQEESRRPLGMPLHSRLSQTLICTGRILLKGDNVSLIQMLQS